MKKTFFMVLILSLVLSATAAETYFTKGSQIVTPQVGLNSYAIPFGASYEVGLTENIGVAANLMVQMWSDGYAGWGWSSTLITPSVEVAYHFNLDVDKMDIYGGAGLGYSIYSFSWDDATGDDSVTGSSSLFLSPFAAARYYFSEKTAVMLKVYFSAVGDWGGVGAVAGVSFKLK